MGEFTREVTDVIIRNWLLRRPGMEDYLHEGHTWGYPSLVVTTPDGTPVAWVAQHFFGVPSFMFVKEDYRGKGIASAILSKITKAIIDRDGYAFSFLDRRKSSTNCCARKSRVHKNTKHDRYIMYIRVDCLGIWQNITFCNPVLCWLRFDAMFSDISALSAGHNRSVYN